MALDARCKNVKWDLSSAIENNDKTLVLKAEYITLALLMDIRDELQTLNKTLKEASIFVNGKVG